MQILGKFCADVRVQNVTWPRDQWSDFRKLGIKRCVRLERKKSWKGASRSAAVARQSRISYRGGQIDPPPPPPVKIGLRYHSQHHNNWNTPFRVMFGGVMWFRGANVTWCDTQFRFIFEVGGSEWVAHLCVSDTPGCSHDYLCTGEFIIVYFTYSGWTVS